MPKFRPFSIFGRLLSAAVVLAGFYLLWLGFMESNILKAVLGGALILLGLYLMVSSRRREVRQESDRIERQDMTGDDSQ